MTDVHGVEERLIDLSLNAPGQIDAGLKTTMSDKKPAEAGNDQRLNELAAVLLLSELVGNEPYVPLLSNSELASVWGLEVSTARRHTKAFRDEHPEQEVAFVPNSERDPKPVYKFTLDQALTIQEERDIFPKPPEGTLNLEEIATQWGVDLNSVRRYVYEYSREHPDVTFQKSRRGNGQELRLTTEQIRIVKEEKLPSFNPPEGSKTPTELAEDWGVVPSEARRRINEFFQNTPDQKRLKFKVDGADKMAVHITAEQIDLMKKRRRLQGDAPEGCVSASILAEKWGMHLSTVQKRIRNYKADNPDATFYGVKSEKSKKFIPVFTPEQVGELEQDLVSDTALPDGAQTISQLSELWGVNLATAYRRVNLYLEQNAGEEPSKYRVQGTGKGSGIVVIYFTKDQVDTMKSIEWGIQREASDPYADIKQDVKEFLGGIDDESSVESQEFRDLVGLFGAERAVDILYRFRPEYRKLPVDYVRSSLADYLGDYLVIKGEFSLGGLKTSAELLADTEFKDGLVEVIKTDCLKLLNRASRAGSEFVTFEAVAEYVEHIREETKGFSTPDLQQVLDEVEAYYDLLFQNIHKPDQFVDELTPGRMFPDINQRINVQEIAFKHRVLIADEMGTGKSASVIMAKEILGVKQAVIVVPGNVVEVWQGYLSDYFKEGRAPRVLTVESPDDLVGIDSASYDYVIISQERLNEEYTEGLLALDYGMLIVDEMHKLKNITDGRRAESLIRLAEKIEDDGTGYLALLSGTPVPNKPSDIAMTLKLLYPDEFKDVPNKQLVSQIINGDILNIRSLLVPRMQMKSLAESVSMPNLEEITHVIEISQEEKDAYEILVEEDELTANEKMQLLRQFMLNPDMLDATPNIIGSKVKAVGEELQKTFATKDKVVMFVNGYIEGVIRGDTTIVPNLNLPDDVHVVTIEGDVPKSRRLEIQEELRTAGHKVLLLVSGQTADVGVDFSAAQEIFFYNEPWTQYDKLQQRGRVYRPGLEGDLISHTFITAGTIEDGIHRYIESKYQAVEKLLRGVPITDIEKEMLRQAEKQVQPDLEFNADLAEHYFSSWDKMMKIYGHVKELGEEDFKKFLAKYDRLYAESYVELVGSRSYQANAGRLAGSLISKFVDEKGQEPGAVRVLDIASGPEMLKRHIPERLADRVVSLDINPHHFKPGQGQRVLGSFVRLPIADKSIDYANLSLSWHYTSFTPTRQNLERMQVLQEINRVLPQGGRAVVTMIYSMDLRDVESFNALVGKLGFRVVGEYSGEASSGTNFKGRVLTLEKTHDCDADASAIAKELGTEGLQGMKFKPTRASLRDVRKMATHFTVGDNNLEVELNETDQQALEEETRVLGLMENMKRQFGSIADIPRSALYDSGLSRIWNGKRYVLFKKLDIGSGAVVIK